MAGFNQNLPVTLIRKWKKKKNDEEKWELRTMTNDYMTIVIFFGWHFKMDATEWLTLQPKYLRLRNDDNNNYDDEQFE